MLPTFAQLADPALAPGCVRRRARGGRARRGAPAQPLPRPLVQRREPARHRRACPEHLVLPRELTGVEATIVVALGDRFPMIGAHKVLAAYGCLAPRRRHRPLRPDAPPRDLALDRELLPRRRRDLAADRLPRRRGAAGGDEPGAVRLARAAGSLDPEDIIRTPGHREQRQGDLRPRATSSPPTRRTSSSTSSPSSGTTSSTTRRPARALEDVFESLRARAAGAAAAGVRLRHRLRRHDRRRRLPEGAATAR